MANPRLVLNPDELGDDPVPGLDLAVQLGVVGVEIRTAWGNNTLQLPDEQIRQLRALVDERGLVVEALASPLWKWCVPAAQPGRVDSFAFPTRVDHADRKHWVLRALHVADLLGTQRIRVFSHLRVEPELTEDVADDPLLENALHRAAHAGMRLLLENEPVCTTATVPAVAAVLRRWAPVGLRWWCDVANLHELGEDAVAAVAELAEYIDYVHIKDYQQVGAHRRFVAAGTGVVPYPQVLPLLARHAPGAPWALETHVRDQPRQALTDGADYLRRTRTSASGPIGGEPA
jgi:sugar phosphate isomerase/epimerase